MCCLEFWYRFVGAKINVQKQDFIKQQQNVAFEGERTTLYQEIRKLD